MKPEHKLEIDELETEIVGQITSMVGQTTDKVRAVRRHYSNKIARLPPELVINLAIRLVDSSDFLLRFVAYELVHYHRPALHSLNATILERLGRRLDSWSAVDIFASYLAGPAWREGQVPDKLIHRWGRSANRWLRRAALVSTVPLNNKARGGRGDVTRTLEICAALKNDRDDMVVKALSWALRELAKREPGSVRDFVKTHRQSLPARVLREVNHKLQTGRKSPSR